MDSSLIENRMKVLKQMRRVCLLREERTRRRNQNINEVRKEKRLNIVNSFRGLDIEWFCDDLRDDNDLDGMPLKPVERLDDYSIDSMVINENFIEFAKKLLKYNRENCGVLTGVEFFQRLSAIIANTITSTALKVAILELIEAIISCMEINVNILINSGIMLSIMICLNTFHIKLVTKIVCLMQMITNLSKEMLAIALENGYLFFLINIIETTQTTKTRKNYKFNQSIYDLKLELIRTTSQSLLSLALDLRITDVIKLVSLLFKKSILFKDIKVMANILTILALNIENNPLNVSQIDEQLLLLITDLLTNNEENITLIVIQILSFIVQNLAQNSMAMKTKLMRSLRMLFEKTSNNSVIKEVANLLSLIIDNFSINANLLIESQIIPLLIKALKAVNYFNKELLLSTLLKIVNTIQSNDILIYLLQNHIHEVFYYLLDLEDTHLTYAVLEAYSVILSIAQKLGQIEFVVEKNAQFYLHDWSYYFDSYENPNISGLALRIKQTFLSPHYNYHFKYYPFFESVSNKFPILNSFNSNSFQN